MTMTTYPRGITSLVRCRSCGAPTDGAGRCIAADCGRTSSDPKAIWAFAIAAVLAIGWFVFMGVAPADGGAVETGRVWVRDGSVCRYLPAIEPRGSVPCQQ